jgi:hypothetical protein
MHKYARLIALLSLAYAHAANADLVLRLDAGNLSTGALANWSDSSNNSFDASQANADNQPSVINGGSSFNNLNVVQFTGNTGATSDYLQNTAVNYDAKTVLAVFSVNTTLRATSKLGQIWGQYTSTGLAHIATDFRNAGNSWSFDGDAGNSSTTARYAVNGGTYNAATAGNAATPWTIDTPHLINAEYTTTRPLNQHYIGAIIPTFDIATHAFGGEIAEILVFNTALSKDERTGLEHLIAQRWGLTGPAAADAGQIAAANALFPGGSYAIPEPSSLSLLLFAGTALFVIRNRFRQTEEIHHV